jgi:trimethylamine monooxygenase
MFFCVSSAEDIGMQAMKYGASSVTYSYRNKPMGYKWPENVEEKPAIAKVANNCVCFIDGSSVKVKSMRNQHDFY